MQKTTQKASILIWSIFLSVIISISFITISTKINENLKNNLNIEQKLQDSSEIKNILSSENPVSQELSNGKYINISNQNIFIGSLKKDEIKQFSFSGSSLENVHIQVNSGGPIKYSYSIGGVFQEKNTIVNNLSFSGNLNIVNRKSELTIENLGGYSLIDIQADGKIEGNERHYDIWKKIGNKNVLIQSGKIN